MRWKLELTDGPPTRNNFFLFLQFYYAPEPSMQKMYFKRIISGASRRIHIRWPHLNSLGGLECQKFGVVLFVFCFDNQFRISDVPDVSLIIVTVEILQDYYFKANFIKIFARWLITINTKYSYKYPLSYNLDLLYFYLFRRKR